MADFSQDSNAGLIDRPARLQIRAGPGALQLRFGVPARRDGSGSEIKPVRQRCQQPADRLIENSTGQ